MGSYYNGFDTKSALKRWLFSGTPAIVPVALTNQAVAQGGQLVDVLNGQYTTPNSKFSDGWAEATLIRESDNGVMVRATLDHAILAVLSPATSAVVLYEWTGSWSALGSMANVYPDDGRPVLVRLQVVGTRARVYCNGVLALDVNTLTYTGGGNIGLRRTAGPGIVAEDLRSQYSDKVISSFPPPFGGIEGGFVLDLSTGRVLLEELVNMDGAPNAGRWFNPNGGVAVIVGADIIPNVYNVVQGISYDDYGAMHVEEVAGGPLPAGTAFINGRPVTKEGKLVVDNTGAITGFLPGGVPHTASGAVAVEGDPVGTVLALADPFFAAPLGQVWSGVGVADYDLATVWFSGAASGSEIVQDAAFYAAAIPVTFYARLKTALAQTATVTLIAGAATIGTITITAGNLLGTVRIVLPAGVAKTAKFKVTLTTPGMHYRNAFGGGASGDLTGWNTLNTANMVLTPVTSAQAIVENGAFVPKVGGNFIPVTNTFADGEVSAKFLMGTATNYVGALVARVYSPNTRIQTFIYPYNGGTTSTVRIYEYVSGVQTIIAEASAGVGFNAPYTARLVLSGNQVLLYVNDILWLTATTTVLGAGYAGVQASSPLDIAMLDDLAVETGGVTFESFAGYVLEADGGPPSTPNPYFNGSTGWAPTAYVAGNKLTIPAGTNPICNTTLPGTVAVTDSVVVRCYVEKGDPNLSVARGQGNTRYTLVEGWNTIDVTPVPAGANAQNMYIVVDGTSVADVVIHFFIAIKL